MAFDLPRAIAFAAIAHAEIANACERFNLPLETWQRQERAFGLLKKVYAKRAKIRGAQPPIQCMDTFEQPNWPDDEANLDFDARYAP